MPDLALTPASLTPQGLAEHMGGKISASTSGLQGRIDGVVSALRKRCGWHVFPERQDTIRVDGPGGWVLSLPTLRLVDLVDLRERGIALGSDEIQWSEIGLVKRNGPRPWTTDYRGIEVSIVHGFDDCADLIDSILTIAGRGGIRPLGETSIRVGERQTNYQVLESELATWDRYRL